MLWMPLCTPLCVASRVELLPHSGDHPLLLLDYLAQYGQDLHGDNRRLVRYRCDPWRILGNEAEARELLLIIFPVEKNGFQATQGFRRFFSAEAGDILL